MSTEPSYFNAYENFSLTRTAAGVLTVRLHPNGGPITVTGATHSRFPRVLEDIAFDRIPRSGSCPATACTSPGKRCSARTGRDT